MFYFSYFQKLLNDTKIVLRTISFVAVKVLRCCRTVWAWNNSHCCRYPNRAKAFKFLIYAVIFAPFVLKPLLSFSFEMMDKGGHSNLMFRIFTEDEKIQGGAFGFDLFNGMIKGTRKGGIVSQIFVSSIAPQSETVNGNEAKQSNGGPNEGDDDFSIYVVLLLMLGISIYFTFSLADEERRKRNRR